MQAENRNKLWLTLAPFGALTTTLVLVVLFDQSFVYRVLMLANFVTLCNLWLVIVFLSGMKAYNRILVVMVLGYAGMIISAFFLRNVGMEGLLLALLLGALRVRSCASRTMPTRILNLQSTSE